MEKKLLIITTDKGTINWGSLDNKLSQITKALNKTQNGHWTVEVQYHDLLPIVFDGRIDRTWFYSISFPFFRKGYHHVAMHFSNDSWSALKLGTFLRGSNFRDNNFVGDMYFRGDEFTKRKGKNQFIQTLLHEMSHELAHSTGTVDKTHEWHDKNPDISGIFSSYNMEKWQPVYQEGIKKISFLQKIVDSLLKKKYNRPVEAVPLILRKIHELSELAASKGIPIKVTETFRSIERQNDLYAQGRTKLGNIVTQAKGGQSLHNYGVAFDVCFASLTPYEGNWGLLGALGESIGLEWGGHWSEFKDRPHFQMLLGYTLKDFQENKVDYTKFN